MANSSFNLINLDFDNIKANLKVYLKSQSIFSDYDFDGSNINVLLDVLAYNTYMNMFYLNMQGAEAYLDSAILRDSVVSRAKELNYLPRSFRSAVANVNITIVPSGNQASVLLAKGTTFTTRIESNTYSFSTDENIIMDYANGNFVSNNVLLYEGPFLTDTFVMNYSNADARYVLSNPNIDTSSLKVMVVEDNGQSILPYEEVTTLLGVQANSYIYFLQACEDNKYEIVFGDNNLGRTPKDNSTIVAEYRTPSGELPNGASLFVSDGTIDGQSNVIITVNSPASGGAISESVNSIKYYAPRHYATQERAVVPSDYETLLLENFPEINDVVAYGGETVTPPQYGKVLISVDISGLETLPLSKINQYYTFLRPRAASKPIFVSADKTYVYVNSTVEYNINLTSLSSQEIKNYIVSAILNYNTAELNSFKSNLRYSKLTGAIDTAHPSISGNDTDIWIYKKLVPTLNKAQNYILNFNAELFFEDQIIPSLHSEQEVLTVSSTEFVQNGQKVHIEDDGVGGLRLVNKQPDGIHEVVKIGSVDYDTGIVRISNLNVSSVDSGLIKLYVKTKKKNYAVSDNNILTIDQNDISVTVNQIRE